MKETAKLDSRLFKPMLSSNDLFQILSKWNALLRSVFSHHLQIQWQKMQASLCTDFLIHTEQNHPTTNG